MIIAWIVLFLLIVAISFLLAFRSMNNYHEFPQKKEEEYGLFLVRRPQAVTSDFLDSLKADLSKNNLIISLERLFKDAQSALTIFGPREVIGNYTFQLNLLELEDYSQGLEADPGQLDIWEVGVKDNKYAGVDNIFAQLPDFAVNEEFFWQVVFGTKGKEAGFKSQIRASLKTGSEIRRKELVPFLQNLGSPQLVKAPSPYSPGQMLEFYRLRSLSRDSKGPILDSAGVVALIKI